jgi:SAM-dependent methyltransferase
VSALRPDDDDDPGRSRAYRVPIDVHLERPAVAIAEARRVLKPGGRYFAATSARDGDPELVPARYPATTFDAEEAPEIVASVFGTAEAQRWDGAFYPLSTRGEVRACCRSHAIAPEVAEEVGLPLWLTKRWVLVRARRVWAEGPAPDL